MAINEVGIKITAVDATLAAARSAAANLESIQTAAGGLNKMLSGLGIGLSVGAFVAFTKSVIDGVDALNDIKDATGSSIENISALEDVARRSGASLDTVGTSLVKLNQALKSAKPGSDTEAAIKAIGLSVKDLKTLDPAEAFRRIAVELGGFSDDANKARLVQELFGKSLQEVAPLLKDLAEQGTLNATVTTKQAEEAEKFNKELFALQKNVDDASRSLAGPLVAAINETIEKFKEGAKEGKSFYSVIVGEQLRFLGLNDGPTEYAERLANITEKLKENNLHESRRAYLLREQAALQKLLANPGRGNVNPDVVDPTRKLPTIGDVNGDADRAAMIAANKELAARGKLIAALSGYTADYEETIRRYVAMRDKGTLTEEAYTRAVREYVASQPGMLATEKTRLDAAKLNTQAVDEMFDAQEKLRLTNEEQIKTGRTMLEQIEFETRLIGLNTAERELANLERELERQGIVKGTQAYDAYIAKLREATAIKSAKEAGIESAEALAAANQKAAEESSKYWEDALMRAFESGKGFFESLWSTIKNTLKTQILKVSVQAVMGTLGLGAAGAAGAADGAMGLASTANALINLPATLSTLSASASALWAGLTATGSTAAGAASAGIAYSSAVAAGSGTAFTTGASLSSVFSAIPVWGWAALGAAALLGMNKKTPSAGTGEGNVTFDASGAPISATSRYTGSWGLTDTVQATLSSLYEDYAKAARSLGIATVQAEFGFGGNTGKEGKDPQFALGVNAGGVGYSSGEIKLTDANVQLAASRAVFAALQGSKLPDYLQGAFDSLTPATATKEQIDAVLGQAAAVKTFHDAVQALPFESLKNLGFDATMALGDASGGLDVLAATLADVTNASANAKAGIQALIDGIDTKVSGSIFDMQYGMEDNAGKFKMLDVRAANLNDQMLASTDISVIAKAAEQQIDIINQAWDLLSADQQKASYLEFEAKLNKIDDYVTVRGADAISLQEAADQKAADAIAAAVEAAVEKAMASSAAAMQAVADKAEKPIEVTSSVNVTVTAPVGSEVSIA